MQVIILLETQPLNGRGKQSGAWAIIPPKPLSGIISTLAMIRVGGELRSSTLILSLFVLPFLHPIDRIHACTTRRV